MIHRVGALALGAAFVACGSGNGNKSGPDAGSDGSGGPADASNLDPVTFSYTPQWNGVQSIAVLGSFGSSTDWTAPLIMLQPTGSGEAGSANTEYAGEAMLPPGSYEYEYEIVGDNAAGSADAATYTRYAIDPNVSAYGTCPVDAPGYKQDAENPCSMINVPQGLADETYTVSGSAVWMGSDVGSGSASSANYIVVIERDESGSHPFFVNRRASNSKGGYNFIVAPGMYRVLVQNPSILSKKDSQEIATKVEEIRQTSSAAFPVSAANVGVSPADVTPPNYAAFAPSGSAAAAPPTTFTFPTGIDAKLDVYGSAAEIGDPFYQATAATTGGSTMFDGTFNTKAGSGSDGSAGSIEPHVTYQWGIEYPGAGSAGATIKWTVQSMVFPVEWP